MKNLLRPLLDVRSIVLIVAFYNFILVYRIAHNWTLGCMLCPWYTEWSFLNPPSLLLLAAIALRLGSRAGCFVALVASGVLVAQGIKFNYVLLQYGEWMESWSGMRGFEINPFLFLNTQYLLALLVFILSVFLTRKTLRPNQ
jgi:hypothetical protein